MEKKEYVRNFIAGIFFLICVILFAVIIFTIGSEKGFTEPKFSMTVYYRNVGGLSMGAPVQLSGVNVGTVSNIDLLEEDVDGRGVKITLSLYEKYKAPLRRSVNFMIITEGVLGEKIVEIKADPQYYRDDLSQPILGEDPLDVENLAVTFGDAAVALLETSKNFDKVAKDLEKISSTTQRLLNRIEQRVIDGNLFKVF